MTRWPRWDFTDWVRRLPDGLDAALSGGGESVSGGQRRRLIARARALINPAPVIVLDEPVEHDRGDADSLLAAIVDPAGIFGPRRTAVIVVTHYLPGGIDADLTIG